MLLLLRSKTCTILTEFQFFFATKSPNVSRFTAELFKVNPLSPKSDQNQISPCNINTLLNRVVMRITDMITQDEFA